MRCYGSWNDYQHCRIRTELHWLKRTALVI
jgi:hypothetical protein